MDTNTFKGDHPPPIIHEREPPSARKEWYDKSRPTKSAWLQTFRRLAQVRDTRYAILWIAGSIVFCLYGKKAIASRERDLMIEDVENYMRNKRT